MIFSRGQLIGAAGHPKGQVLLNIIQRRNFITTTTTVSLSRSDTGWTTRMVTRVDHIKNSVWYLNSGCSKHMIGDASLLSHIENLLGPKISFGDASQGDMYRKIAEDMTRCGCSWESFEVYRHLKNLGYIFGRHGIPWSLKNVKPDATVEEGSEEFDLTRENGSISSSFIAEKLSVPQLSTKPIGRPPSKHEIENLEIRCGNHLKFCIVDMGGSVSCHSPK